MDHKKGKSNGMTVHTTPMVTLFQSIKKSATVNSRFLFINNLVPIETNQQTVISKIMHEPTIRIVHT